MRIWPAVLVVVVVGCKTDDTIYPIIPGGPTGPITGHPDGGGGGGDAMDAGPTLSGRACLVVDPRDLLTCATTGAGGLTVQLGTKTATTADNGSFTIGSPQSTDLEWTIGGTAVVTSVMRFSAITSIPVFSTTLYGDLESGNGVLEVAGNGAVMARVLQTGAPAVGATAATTPVAAYATFYDGSSTTTWNQSSTGAFGVLWVPGIVAGTATLTITPQGGTAQPVDGIRITDGGITFVTVELP